MKRTRMAAFALVAAALWLPTRSAYTASTAAPDQTISFDQYRDYRIHSLEQRRSRLAERLSATGLAADEKARLQRQKEYYDWLAAMPGDERDRRFHDRFDLIDSNHDGTIDAAERAAWRGKERDYYRKQAAERIVHPD